MQVNNRRKDRIASLLKSEIALILRKKVGDKRIGLVSIVDVKVSRKLDSAWVYYSILGDAKAQHQTQKGLEAAAKYIKGEIGKNLHIYPIPDIKFRYDNSLERGSNIINKLNELSSDQ